MIISTWDGKKRRNADYQLFDNHCTLEWVLNDNLNRPSAYIDFELGYIKLSGKAYLISNLEEVQ